MKINMKKLLLIFTVTMLFSCDYFYVSKGSRLESVSKKESKFKNRLLGEYNPNKSVIKICDSVYSIPNIWVEKFRDDLDFYNYVLDMKLHFNQELNFKVMDTTFNYGYTQGRIIIRNKQVNKEKFSIIFEDKSSICRDTIVFSKAF